MDEPILMNLYTVVVHDLRMYIKKDFKGDNELVVIIGLLVNR